MQTLTIRVHPAQRDALDAVARRRGVAIGTAVREVLSAGLQGQGDADRLAALEARLIDRIDAVAGLIKRLAIEDEE